MKKDAKDVLPADFPSVSSYLSQHKFEEFLAWIEITSLFHALRDKNQFDAIDSFSIRSGQICLEDINPNIVITKALDLPYELMLQFYINSPFYKTNNENTIQKT